MEELVRDLPISRVKLQRFYDKTWHATYSRKASLSEL